MHENVKRRVKPRCEGACGRDIYAVKNTRDRAEKLADADAAAAEALTRKEKAADKAEDRRGDLFLLGFCRTKTNIRTGTTTQERFSRNA